MSSSTPTPKGTDAPAWTRRGDSDASWRATRDPNAAFRGTSRNRGRGGGTARGKPGGGRGAGGRSVSARLPMDISKSTPPPRPPLPEKAGATTTGAGGAATKNNAGPPKLPKAPSRPNINMDGQTAQSSDSLLSPNKPARRVGRNTHRRAASASVPKPILPDSLPVSPSTPLMLTTKDPRDPPPHKDQGTDGTTHVHDLRQEITDLVDRVRTMAMDGVRPKSPATHIDWAGEDDDSLPDLDDWGISSKLVSDVGEPSAKTTSKQEPVTQTLPADTTSTSISEKVELKELVNGQATVVDLGQSSAESPTESSMSLSLSAPAPVKRTRERRRGGRKDKKLLLASQANGSNAKPVPLITTPKKSLLERMSSPARSGPPLLPQDSAPTLSTPDRTINSSKSEPSMSIHSSLPPKPPSLPKKPVSPNKPSESWRNKQPNRSVAPKEVKKVADRIDSVVSEKVTGGNMSGEEKAVDVPPAVEQKQEPVPTMNTSSFDWSEEPLSSGPNELPNGLSVDVEPPTPSVTTTPAPLHSPRPPTSSLSPSITEPKLSVEAIETKSNASTHSSPRFRSQRPLSGDATPRSGRRDRSPYKSHTPRNHSLPHVWSGSAGGGSPTGRPRPQHATRPVIRMDALAMISRSLRESPTPPRRDSPPVTKVGEAS